VTVGGLANPDGRIRSFSSSNLFFGYLPTPFSQNIHNRDAHTMNQKSVRDFLLFRQADCGPKELATPAAASAYLNNFCLYFPLPCAFFRQMPYDMALATTKNSQMTVCVDLICPWRSHLLFSATLSLFSSHRPYFPFYTKIYNYPTIRPGRS